jgi:taurine dioxygenase
MTLLDQPTDLGFSVRLLSGSIGAEIHGLDLHRDLDEEVIESLRTLWLRRRVLFFKEAHVDAEEHKRFARQFGELTPGHPVIPGLADHPEVFQIDYSESRQVYAQYGDVHVRRAGLDWHTDVTFVERPPAGSILSAVRIPEAGGDTMWSDQVAAFAALSESLRGYLATLTAVHDGRAAFGRQLKERGEGSWDGEPYRELVPVEHPVMRIHPETGEQVLFVNRGFTSHIKGLHADESAALLSFLYAHSTRPEFVVRHHWNQGDLAFWDNRATQHSVVGDYGDAPRVIQRVTLRGDRPF